MWADGPSLQRWESAPGESFMQSFLIRVRDLARRSPASIIVVAALLIAAVIAVPIAVTASGRIESAASPAGPHSPKPVSMGTYTGKGYASAAKALPPGLTNALQRDVHLTPAQYLANSAAAVQGVKVVAALKSAGVSVLGSKMDGTKLIVNVASAQDVAPVKAAGATAVIGAPPKADYSNVDFQAVSSTDTYGGEAYFFQEAGQAGTQNGIRCSIGFNGYAVSTGAPEFLTAGHCETTIPAGGPVTLLNQSAPTPPNSNAGTLGAQLGSGVTGTYGALTPDDGSGEDYGIISSGGAGISPQPAVVTWGGGSTGAPLSSAPLGVTGETAGIDNATLCKSGSSSGWTCGTILSVDTTVPVSGQPVNAIVATTCLIPGDSGGAALIGSDAVGIDSGSSFGTSCGTAGAESVFFPMVSTAGNDSVVGQQGANWHLLAAPVVTYPAQGAAVSTASSMTGTLFQPNSASTVSLFVDGSSTALGTASAATGTWTIPLAGLADGVHSYSLSVNGGAASEAAVSGKFVVNAQGSFDSATAVPGGIQISGWSLDLSTTASTYVWVNVDGRGGPVFANASLPWINALFPGEGTNHGFAATLPASPGNHTVCVYGTNSLALGCKTVSVPQNAQGSFDSATGVPGGIQISGWSLDLSTTASTYVWVNVDGTGGPVYANVSLPWINALFPGEGTNHGFAATLPASPGNHTVCVYGTNSLALGCKSVAVPAATG